MSSNDVKDLSDAVAIVKCDLEEATSISPIIQRQMLIADEERISDSDCNLNDDKSLTSITSNSNNNNRS